MNVSKPIGHHGNLSADMAAEMLGVKKSVILNLIGTGRLEATNVSNVHVTQWEIDPNDLQNLLASRSNIAKPVLGERYKATNPGDTRRIIGSK